MKSTLQRTVKLSPEEAANYLKQALDLPITTRVTFNVTSRLVGYGIGEHDETRLESIILEYEE